MKVRFLFKIWFITVAYSQLIPQVFSPVTTTSDQFRKDPYLIFNGNPSDMRVLWQLNATDTCTIKWGIDTLYTMGVSQTYEYGTNHQHSFLITNLAPGTKYFYQVITRDTVRTASFYAAPDSNATTLKFLAYGDTRSHPDIHDKVAAAMVNTFLADDGFQSMALSVGDLVTDGDDESDWDLEFFNPSYPSILQLLASLPYQVAMGNHEGTGALFTKYFPYPYHTRRYWSFDYGPAHFVIVDQYTDYSSGSAQLEWIEDDLKSTQKKWKFLCLHEPGYSSGGGHSNNTSVQQYIQPLCELYNVAIVFAGHNHYYARAFVGGVQHITTGGGGAPLHYPVPGYSNVVSTSRVYHYCKIEIIDDTLSFKVTRTSEAVVDSFKIIIGVQEIGDDNIASIPKSVILYPAYPNPFNPRTSFEFYLPHSNDVTLKVYNVRGEVVTTLVSERLAAGRYTYPWDASNIASGVYFYRLSTQRFLAGETKESSINTGSAEVATRKVILLR